MNTKRHLIEKQKPAISSPDQELLENEELFDLFEDPAVSQRMAILLKDYSSNLERQKATMALNESMKKPLFSTIYRKSKIHRSFGFNINSWIRPFVAHPVLAIGSMAIIVIISLCLKDLNQNFEIKRSISTNNMTIRPRIAKKPDQLYNVPVNVSIKEKKKNSTDAPEDITNFLFNRKRSKLCK
jgi:hypothetical protein